MAPKKRRLSSLIESQLPGFIQYEYENFSKFVEKYYEHVESAGQPLDILSNIGKYRDINTYESNLLKQSSALSSSITQDQTEITLVDASSFPEENGYIKIGEEILFYQTRDGNTLESVSRGVSGNTTLGDLYSASTFVTTAAAPHYQGDVVSNVSNLFLYALVKQFEKSYLSEFPEAYLKGDVDKRNLIKNITSFYKTKGTDRSVKFLFNAIVTNDPKDIPEIVNPKDYTIKASVSDWTKNYSLKVIVNSGNVNDLIGQRIVQQADPLDSEIQFASAVVDTVVPAGNDELGPIYEIILEPTTINGSFVISGRTKTTTVLSSTKTAGDRINVRSTMGFPKNGKLLIGDEQIVYSDKTVNQFIISNRIGPIRNHASKKDLYRYTTITGNGVSVTALGMVYNMLPTHSAPYSSTLESIQVGDAGVETIDPVIWDDFRNRNRWKINTDPSSNTLNIQGNSSDISADVGAIFEDEQYFYIASSSFPSGNILVDTDHNTSVLKDQKSLKLIRKQPITTTEVYKTSNRDVGVFIDGVPAIGYKSEDFEKYGPIVSVELENKGFSYEAPPYVLVNEQPNKARCTLNGSTVNAIEILTEEIFTEDPAIRITSGEGAILSPVITAGAITSMDIVDAGRYYSSPPIIRIADNLGRGAFAEFEAILDSDGSISEVHKISSGRFYTSGSTTVVVEPAGKGASASASIRRWVYNRYNQIKNNLDANNGTLFVNYDSTKEYGYGYIANPLNVRTRAYVDQNAATLNFNNQSQHSPIIGYAYDGNPIYGPYGYSDPVDSSSMVQRLSSGYQLKSTRVDGPDAGVYLLGTFIDDYEWVPSVNSGKTELDQNNGRFCVTPDYPNGVYAYFISVDDTDSPTFPYILGDNYYSLPVDSNYNSPISQDDIPLGVKAIRTVNSTTNGSGFTGLIQDVTPGSVSSMYVEDSPNNFSPGNEVYFDNSKTGGDGVTARVEKVTGRQVSSIESTETKATQVKVQESAYLFEGDQIQQKSEDGSLIAQGNLIGDVFNSSEMILRDVVGSFGTEYPITSETLVVRLVLDRDSTFTAGAAIRLTNDDDEDIASGVILETTSRQNSVKVRVDSYDPLDLDEDGSDNNFIVTSDYYLRSSNLSDTNRSQVESVTSLSSDLSVFYVNQSIAIVSTSDPHNLGKGDSVEVEIFPADIDTETTYYVRKRLYQTGIAFQPTHNSTVTDKGIGSADVLNSGLGYQTDTYNDVELIFRDSTTARRNIGLPGDSGNAKATIVVSNPAGLGTGGVSDIIITSKGEGYRKGDILTVADEDLNRLITETSSQRLVMEVDHVGFAAANTVLYLTNVVNVSQGDYLNIGQEIVLVESVETQTNTVVVSRGQQNTTPQNHYDGGAVTLKDGYYRFEDGFRPFGEDIVKPFLISYDQETQSINVSYDYNASNPQVLSNSSSFFDSSVPQKLVTFRTVEEENFKLEFSTDNTTFNTNPTLDIQKYYKYKFDTSHFSMLDTYLDFSASSNLNIFTEEKEVSGISPGNAGSFVSIKLGFGPAIAGNTYENTQPINFQNYFYFIKVSPNVNTDGSFLRIIDDPLTGFKEIIYNTPTKFVYELGSTPAYDGSGTMTYITTSRSAIGEISSVNVVNSGDGYFLSPIVQGVSTTSTSEASVEPVWDPVQNKVLSFTITNKGSGYVNPKIVYLDTDGTEYSYETSVSDGELVDVNVVKTGFGFTYPPVAKVIEAGVKIYPESDTIGLPKNIKILNPGKGFNSDESQLSSYNSPTTFVLRNISDRFYLGEKIVQDSTGATAQVTKDGWREGSNLLRVFNINGVFKTGDNIRGDVGNRTALLYAQLSTEFEPDIRSYVDNFGEFTSDRGKLSNYNQKLQDSFFYQDYSYVIKSKTSINQWRSLIKETIHPAGFKLFGEMIVDSKADIPMPTVQPSLSYTTNIELPPVQVYTLAEPDNFKRTINTLIQYKKESLFVEEGTGSISVDTFDISETQTYRISLTPEFDGDFDPSTGQLIGTTEFSMVDDATGTFLSGLSKDQQLIVTLDGVFQEPGKAFTIEGNKIIFAQPPLGKRISEGQDVDPVKFYGRAIKFKETSLNNRYFKKVQKIDDQFDGFKFEFDLYWEDGSIVKSDPSENFIVSLNGVVQKARLNETEPFGNAYSIIRNSDSSITDKIRFSKPPIDNEDAYGPED
ncbi:MAG: hypothetical protein CL961_03050, partial [Euryarchaeota archaeon]|nr:hypothetical protein [Euryarchaeota archaeon]